MNIKLSHVLMAILLPAFAIGANAVAAGEFCPIDIAPQISAETKDLNPYIVKLAITAYDCARASGIVDQQEIITIIDFSLPDTKRRLWVIDLKTKKVLFNTYVAHGQGSGGVIAKNFSDDPQTHASSLGLYLTSNTYYGHDGYSMRLIGLDKGFNDKALSREIVMHGAPYVGGIFLREFGHLGRSWGCTAVPRKLLEPIVNVIKQGTLIFAYYPQKKWLSDSKFLHCQMTKELNYQKSEQQKISPQKSEQGPSSFIKWWLKKYFGHGENK